jgi:hypothetical protein
LSDKGELDSALGQAGLIRANELAEKTLATSFLSGVGFIPGISRRQVTSFAKT